jgi:hypothetical protein
LAQFHGITLQYIGRRFVCDQWGRKFENIDLGRDKATPGLDYEEKKKDALHNSWCSVLFPKHRKPPSFSDMLITHPPSRLVELRRENLFEKRFGGEGKVEEWDGRVGVRIRELIWGATDMSAEQHINLHEAVRFERFREKSEFDRLRKPRKSVKFVNMFVVVGGREVAFLGRAALWKRSEASG